MERRRTALTAAWDREKPDLLAFAIAAVTAPLVWWLFLGWNPSLFSSSNDWPALTIGPVRWLFEAEGRMDRWLFRAELMGGAKLRDVVGHWPFLDHLAALGFPPNPSINASNGLAQAMAGFIGARLASDLAKAAGGARFGLGARSLVSALIAFAPAMGWWIGWGHQSLIYCLLPWLTAIALSLAYRAGNLSLTLVLVSFYGALQGFAPTAQQLILYSAVFGFPIAIGFALVGANARAAFRSLSFGILVPAAACLVNLPDYVGMLDNLLGPDSLRTIGKGESFIYSYVTGNWGDWLTSLPWTLKLLTPTRGSFYWHETNMPLGPLLLLLPLVFRGALRPAGIGLTIAWVVSWVFTMDIEPFSTWLATLIPPLHAFRVPHRSFTVVLLAAWPLAAAAVQATHAARTSSSGQRAVRREHLSRAFPFIAGLAAIGVAPPLPRELAAWTAGALLVAPALSWAPAALVRLATRRSVGAAALGALLAASIGGYRDRLVPFASIPQIEETEREVRALLGAAAKHVRPEGLDLASPLTRVASDLVLPSLRTNTSLGIGLSTLDAYWFPQRQFAELVSALRGQAFDPTLIDFAFRPGQPGFEAIASLYNVCCQIRRERDGALTFERLPHAGGAAWFPVSLHSVSDFPSLARELRARDARSIRASVLLLERDLARLDAKGSVRRAMGGASLEGCEQARVVSAGPSELSHRFEARVDLPGSSGCPLVFAVNYASRFRAWADDRETEVFPAYGALAGIWVPPASTRIRLEYAPFHPPWSDLGRWLGWALLVALLGWFAARGRVSEDLR